MFINKYNVHFYNNGVTKCFFLTQKKILHTPPPVIFAARRKKQVFIFGEGQKEGAYTNATYTNAILLEH